MQDISAQNTPTSPPTLPPTPSSTFGNRIRKLFKFILILIAITLISLASGALGFMLGKNNNSQTNNPDNTKLPTVTQEPTISKSTSPIFQKILTQYCKEVKLSQTAASTVMKIEDLPITIDRTKIQITPLPDTNAEVGCIPIQDHGYFFIPVTATSSISVYDDNSQELGHGGPLDLTSYGTLLDEEDGVRLTTYLGLSSGPVAIGEVPVVLRGVKTINLANNEVIYATYSTIILEKDDPKLIKILDDNSDTNEVGDSIIDSLTVQNLINKTILSQDKNSPEQQKIQELKKILSGIKAK